MTPSNIFREELQNHSPRLAQRSLRRIIRYLRKDLTKRSPDAFSMIFSTILRMIFERNSVTLFT